MAPSIILTCFLADLTINIAGWAICCALKTDKLYDLLGATSHIVVAWLALSRSSDGGVHTSSSGAWELTRASLVTMLISAWAVRLGAFLFTRILRSGHDKRLLKYVERPGPFLFVWFAQSLWVFFNTLPLLLLASRGGDVPLGGLWDSLALGCWGTGFLLQLVADEHKRAFRSIPANAKRFISSGLWSWSRHPNYFGEMLMTVSLAALAMPGLLLQGEPGQELAWSTQAGSKDALGSALAVLFSHAVSFAPSWFALLAAAAAPSFEVLLLLKVSGVPLLEADADKRWGDDPAYKAYKARTPVLVPVPPICRRH